MLRYNEKCDIAIFHDLIIYNRLSQTINYWDWKICKRKILQVKWISPRYFNRCPFILSLNTTIFSRRKSSNNRRFRWKDWVSEIISSLQFVEVDLTVGNILSLNKFELIEVRIECLKYQIILSRGIRSNRLINIIR